MARNVTRSELQNLLETENYVCINTDRGYKKELQNSLQDYYQLTGAAAKEFKKHPIVQAILKDLNVINIIEDAPVVENNNNNAAEVVKAEVDAILETV